jgi:hypothetical protein
MSKVMIGGAAVQLRTNLLSKSTPKSSKAGKSLLNFLI